ncbi:MAG: hypothetical protein J0651_03395, partial [Actinobacteria bacterium]|nr:hypothetical protein [Actinomycetota bacterium]
MLAYTVALPATLIWGLGIPAVILLLLVRFRKRLSEKRVRTITSFLCEGYQSRFYFWEVVIMVR